MSFTRQDRGGVVFHTADVFSAAGGVAHGFATRLGGVSRGDFAELNFGTRRGDDPEAVRENYRRFCLAVGASPDRIVRPHQVHKDEVREATIYDAVADVYAPMDYEADGLITNRPGLALFVYYADCIPVLFYDPIRRVVAVVHSGWRGAAMGIAPHTAKKMARDYGCRMEDILVAIGPGICPQCFETHVDVPTVMNQYFGPRAATFSEPLPNGKYHFDLKGLIEFSLMEVGIREISVLPLCTGCRPDLYWSHRKLGDRRGNQAAVIQLL